jgi:selenocysteine lyase/cysteine desulfurase
MMDKRDFLRAVGGVTLGTLLGERTWAQHSGRPAAELAEDEAFWALIRGKYRLKPGLDQPRERLLLDAVAGRARGVPRARARGQLRGRHYMRTRQVDDKLEARKKVAALAGCDPEELIITRNTTESLDTVIAGHDWKPGDEAVMARRTTARCSRCSSCRRARFGLVNRLVLAAARPAHGRRDRRPLRGGDHGQDAAPDGLPHGEHHGPDPAGAQDRDMARGKGVAVMVDGAHAFAQLEFKIGDLGCDYYGASLHKWLGCPLGAGLLWVKRDRIAKLWPLFGDSKPPDGDIRKLNHTGTHPVHTDLAICDAIKFHESIGTKRKEARLRHLQQYWTTRVRGTRNIVLNTPSDPSRACAIANVGVAGTKPADLAKVLFEKHRIYTVAIDHAGVHGVRVTPQLYTSTAELDALVRALKEIAAV